MDSGVREEVSPVGLAAEKGDKWSDRFTLSLT
jgi:hypothetical protein